MPLSRVVTYEASKKRKRREQESYFHVRRTIRIVVVGSEFVGKTAIISRFTSSNFPKKYVPTVEDMFRLTVNEVDLEILDTSGSFEFPAMRELAVATGHAFIIVYGQDDEESFETARNLKELVRQTRGYTAPIIIVANKADLKVYDSQGDEEKALVRGEWGCEFHSVSARFSTQRAISAIFEDVICHETVSEALELKLSLRDDQYAPLYIFRGRLINGDKTNNKSRRIEERKLKQSSSVSSLSRTVCGRNTVVMKRDLRYFFCLT